MNLHTSANEMVMTSTDIITQSNEWVTVAQQVYDYQAMIKDLEKKHKLAMDRLKILSHGKTSHGGGFLLAKEIRRGSILWKQIPEIIMANIDFEKYRGEDVVAWKLIKLQSQNK